ncbi:MAG: three-Cys-motif partner protein TcmP [Nitriliruptorales bacterium]
MARARDLPDSHQDKWVYSLHTRAKHEILRRYLGAWFSILGHQNPLLVILDGFAGKGKYTTGQAGSPKIIFDRAVQVVEDGRARRVEIRCVELDATNYSELALLCDSLKHENVRIDARHGAFAGAAKRLAEWAEGKKYSPPIFVSADPYGFRGVPLDVVSRLMEIDRVEVMVTFMARDMSRFLDEPNVEQPLTEFFGGDAWRQCSDAQNRPECLLLRYREVVLASVADHVIPFRVFEDERMTILYYLVHLTNNDRGMREMKEAMVAESPDMTFWPVTVRPREQLAMDVAEQAPFRSLQDHILDKYEGRTLTFLEILNDDYPDGVWIEKQYRAALNALERSEEDGRRITVARNRTTPTGRAPRGMKYADTISFP